MNWKTCSVEVRAGIGKRRIAAPVGTRNPDTVSGMQKNELTMFRAACYSSLVPRVHLGLLYAATFLRACVQKVRE